MNLFQLATRGVDLSKLPDEEAPRQSVAFEPSTSGGKFSVPSDLNDAFEFAAKDFGIDPDVLRAVAYAESRFHPDVVSGKVKSKTGATGLMQFMPKTAQEYGIDPLDPVQSIFGAAAYLRKSLDRFDGNYGKAVASYNAGPNRQDFDAEDWDARMPAETQGYLRTVFTAADQLKQGGADTAKPTQAATAVPDTGDDTARLAARYKAPRTERTYGEAAADTGAQLVEGVNNILGAVPNLIAPDSGVAQFFKGNADTAQSWQSDAIKQRTASAGAAIDKAGEDGVIAQVVEAAKQYSSDPALAARFVVTNLPSMIPGIGAAKLAQAAALARGATLAQAAATATTVAGGMNAALNAGGARGEAFEDLKTTLMKQGMPEAQATERALTGSLLPAAVGGVAGFISGKTGLEGAIVGKAGAKAAVTAGAKSLGAELGGEQLEEVAPKLATNYQASQIDNRSLGKDVGRTIVETAIGSGPGSVYSGVQAGLNARAAPTVESQPTTPTAPQVTPSNGVYPKPVDGVYPNSTATQAVDNIAALLKQTEANIDGTATQATPVQPGSQAVDAGAAPVAQGPEGANEGSGYAGTAAATGQSESAQSLSQIRQKQEQVRAAMQGAVSPLPADIDTVRLKQEFARMHATAKGGFDPMADVNLQTGANTTGEDVKRLVTQARQAVDAKETAEIQRMLAEDAAAKQEMADAARTTADGVRSDSDRETQQSAVEGLAQRARTRLVDSLVASYAEPTGYFASPLLKEVASQLGVLQQPALSKQEQSRITELVTRAQVFVAPNLPADKASTPTDIGADNASMESLIKEKQPKPAATGLAAEMAALKARANKPRQNKAPKPLLTDGERDMLADFERMYQSDVKGEIKTRLGLMPARQDEATAPAEKRKPSELLAAIRRAGGIKSTNAADLMGGSAMDANRILPGLFKKDGMNLDLLVPFLKERGYLTQADEDSIKDNGGVNKLAEILQAELSGDRAQTVDSTAGYEADADKAMRSDLDSKAFALGLPMKVTNEMSTERLNGVINRIERKLGKPVNTDFATRKMSRTEAMAERQAILMADRVERARAQYDSDIQAFAEADDAVQDAVLEIATDADGNVDIVYTRAVDAASAADALNGQWSDQNAEVDTSRAGASQKDSGQVGAPVAQGARTGSGNPEANRTEAGAGQEGLTSYTPAEVTARQNAAAQAEAATKRAEDAAARAEAAAKQASEIAQRSVAAADTFELGGNAEDNLSGQQGLRFSKSTESPRTQASTIRTAITKAYGNLLTRLEGKGLVSLTQTEEEAIAAAAQARADKTGGDVEQIKRQMLASVQMQRVLPDTIIVDGVTRPTTNSNGQPIHPTEEGVRNFWKWFGDSKVVDDKGRPLVVYHGGKSDISEFDRKNLGSNTKAASARMGFFFASSPLVASGYAVAHNEKKNQWGNETKEEFDRRVSISRIGKRIADAEYELEHYAEADYLRAESDEERAEIYSKMNPSAKIEADKLKSAKLELLVAQIEPDSVVYPVYLKINKPLTHAQTGFHREAKFASLVSDAIKNTDDGVIIRDTYDPATDSYNEKTTVYVAFSPTQIKSATGNTGAFSQTDVDIRRSANGNIEGFFDRQTGKSFLVADNLTAASAPGTLMHEVGIHMAADGKLEPLFTRAAQLLKLGKNNPFIQRVQARMDQAGETSNEEAAAYIVTEYEKDRTNAPASVGKWIKDFIADVRAWMFAKGVLLKADQLTVADIAAVARANANRMAQGGGNGDVRYSRGTTTGMLDNKAPSPQGDAQQGAVQGNAVIDAGIQFVSAIETLAEKHGRVYIRWSPGAKGDLSSNQQSRDFVSGATHSGLSAVEITGDMHPVDIASRLSEYGFLRMQDKRSAPRVYLADRVGTDSDGYASIKPTELLIDSTPDVVKAIDSKLSDIMDAMDDVQRESEKLAMYPGHKAVTERLESAKAKLNKLLPNEQSTPTSQGVRFSRGAGSKQAQQNLALNTPSPAWMLPASTKTDALVYELQDQKVDLKRTQEAIKAAGRTITEPFDARMAETLMPGRVAYRTETFLKTEVAPLMEAMAKNNVTQNELSDYLLARHAPERNAQIAKVNPEMPDGGAGTNSQGVLMTTQAAQDHIAALTTGKRMVLQLLANKIDAITASTRDLLVREGLEKQSTMDAWTGAYKHYVPLFKDEAVESPAHPVGSGMSVTGGASKRAMGSEGEVTNMVAHILMQREAAITRAEKNRVAMSLYGLALSNPNQEVWTTIRPNMRADKIGAELAAMGVDPVEAEQGMQGVPTIRTINSVTGLVQETPNPMYKRLDNALVVKVDGEDRVILFNAKNTDAMRMARALKNQDGLTNFDLAGSMVGTATRYFASINTQYNPAFGMVNVVRDIGGALVNLTTTGIADKKAKVLGDIPAAMKGIARDVRGDQARTPWSDLWVQFQEDGGRTGYRDLFIDPFKRAEAVQKDLDAMQRDGTASAGRVAHSILDLLDDFNTTLENGVRLSAYKAALDKGMSRPAAAKMARELTVDFNRKGRTGREVGPLYAFFNASVQGTARTIESLKGPAGKKIIAGGLMLGVIQSLMLAAAGFDDDEPPEFVKARAFIIPMGDKRYIAIPLQFGLNALPNTGRVITDLMLTGGKDAGKKTFNAIGEIMGSFNPLGGGNIFTAHGLLTTVAPTVADPLVDLATNTNFAGTPIGKDRADWDTRPGAKLARESTQRSLTGQAYIGISKAINALSGGNEFKKGLASPTPEQVQYVFTTTGGGLYRELEKTLNIAGLKADGFEIKSRMIPLGGRFAGEADDQDTQRSRYYRNSERLAALEAELKGFEKDGNDSAVNRIEAERSDEVDLLGDYKHIRQAITKLNKLAADNINDMEMLKELDVERLELMRELNDSVRKLEKRSELFKRD